MSAKASERMLLVARRATEERFKKGSTWTLTVLACGDLPTSMLGHTHVGEVVMTGSYTVHFRIAGSGRLVVGLPEGSLCRDSDRNFYALARLGEEAA